MDVGLITCERVNSEVTSEYNSTFVFFETRVPTPNS